MRTGAERSRQTSGAIWYLILAIWAVSTAFLVWRFLPWLSLGPMLPVSAFLLVSLSYFVLTGAFNVVVNVASHMLKEAPPQGGETGTPEVAVFYCTYNDFDRDGADSLLAMTYPCTQIWVLDDSTKGDARTAVDAFAADAAAEGHRVRVVRRPDRRGFKAGAINHALRMLPPDVAYVAIVDADERVTPDFVQGCLRHFTGEDIAFVQANHRCINGTDGWFTRHLGLGVDLHWRHYQRYRNRYGTVNMLGHGAIVRREVLDELGGFPEMTCEDLAFTVEAKIAGYRGAFASDVVCGETFPEDFSAMRRRHLRWSWGTVEFLRRCSLPFMRSRARFHEKLDLLLPSINLPAVFVLLAFLGVVNALQWTGAELPALRDPIVLAFGAFAALAPLLMFVDLFRRPGFALKAIIVNTAAYLALFPLSVVGVLRGLTRPAEFLVTPKGVTGRLSLARATIESKVEIAFGLGLTASAVMAIGPMGILSPLSIAAFLVPVLMSRSRRPTPSKPVEQTL